MTAPTAAADSGAARATDAGRAIPPEQAPLEAQSGNESLPPPSAPASKGALVVGLAVVVLVSYIAFFAGLGSPSLWRAQEGRVALIARHMLQSGDWITPARQQGIVEEGKPVLYHWLVALLGWMRGFDEVTARAPSAAAGLAVAVLLYLWVRRLSDDRSGLVAALVFVTSVLAMAVARCAHVDMLLTLWIVLAYYSFFRGCQEEGRRRRWFLLGYAALALAVMTKGPVGLALVVAGVGTFLLARGKLRLLGRMQLLPGVLVFLALAAPWYVAVGVKTHGDFLARFLIGQNFVRFFGFPARFLQAARGDPWWFYGPQLVLATLPWTPFVLGSLFDRASTLWRRRETSTRDEATALATAWFAAGFLLLSLSRGKRLGYLLPLMPSLALLAGCFWQHAFPQEVKGRARSARAVAAVQGVLFVVTASLMLSLTVLSPLSEWWRNTVTQPLFPGEPDLLSSLVEGLERFLPVAVAATVALVLAGWFWLRAALRPRPLARPGSWHTGGATFAFTVGLMLACQWFYQQAALPSLDEWFGFRTMAADVDRVVPPGQSVAIFGDYPQGLLFYLQHPVQLLRPGESETLARAVAGPAPLYCVLPLPKYLALPSPLRAELRPLYQGPARARQRFVVATNTPARTPGDPATPNGAAVAADAREPE